MWITTKVRLSIAVLTLTGASVSMTGMFWCSDGVRRCTSCDEGPAGDGWKYAVVYGQVCESNVWFTEEEFYEIGGETEELCGMVENECDIWANE